VTRRRIVTDLCTYEQSTASANSSPYCTGKAAFTVGPLEKEAPGVTDFHRVCLKHVGHAAEVIRERFDGAAHVLADYERVGNAFSDDPPASPNDITGTA
jgi:hypothetical protein